MAITIKTPEEIEKMRVAGRLAAEALEMIEEHIKPGVSTGEIDRICHEYITNEQQALSACPSNCRACLTWWTRGLTLAHTTKRSAATC